MFDGVLLLKENRPVEGSSKPSKSYWALLALTRYILALIVCCSHYSWFGADSIIVSSIGILGGRTAVICFLIISGISISASYNERPESFYHRRFLRIYPLYSSAVLFTAFVQCLFSTNPLLAPHYDFYKVGLPTIGGNLLLLQGFLCNPIMFDGPVWTLSLEVLYYILTPVFSGWPKRYLAALGFLSLLIFVTDPWSSYGYFGYLALKWLWPWIFGFMLMNNKFRVAMVLVVLGLLAVEFGAETKAESLRLLTYSFVLFIVFGFPSITLGSNVRNILLWLGDLSFPLYLFHLPLMIFLYCFLGMHNVVVVFGTLLFTVILVYYSIDVFAKRVIWRPVVECIEGFYSRILTQRTQNPRRQDVISR